MFNAQKSMVTGRLQKKGYIEGCWRITKTAWFWLRKIPPVIYYGVCYFIRNGINCTASMRRKHKSFVLYVRRIRTALIFFSKSLNRIYALVGNLEVNDTILTTMQIFFKHPQLHKYGFDNLSMRYILKCCICS